MATDLSSTECRLLLDRLVAGQPPPIPLAHRFLVGFDDLLVRWRNDMASYVSEGGSLLRIVAAPVGEGKTHLARALQAIAAEMDFLNCHIDAQSQHTDDDLSLHGALCGSLLTPSAVLEEQSESGLLAVFRHVADRISEADARKAVQSVDVPVAFLRDLIPRVIGALRRWEDARVLSIQAPDVAVALRLIAGQQVDATRSLRRLRLTYDGPVLRAMARTPGKRDAKLWIESLLRILPRLGFRGVLVSIDEHDYANQRLLDRHIVQLRRLADGLASGHLPGVFVVLFVLDDFRTRVDEQHSALAQRIHPILRGRVPNRILSKLAELRDTDGSDFLVAIGQRLHGLVNGIGQAWPATIEARCCDLAKANSRLGGPDTRAFVKSFAGFLQETYDN